RCSTILLPTKFGSRISALANALKHIKKIKYFILSMMQIMQTGTYKLCEIYPIIAQIVRFQILCSRLCYNELTYNTSIFILVL
ncbi:hypothetical protein, partial [Salmonella enterica]|uniref:hypothetical protein n=1 Tax=Salmonella enterica TaxID=28901 RepID=UPI0039E869D6